MQKGIQKISYQELKERLNSIPVKEDRVFLKTIYAAVGRVGEIVRPFYQTYKGVGLMPKDIQVTDSTLLLNILTEKRNTLRIVPIARIDNPEHEYFKQNESWLTEEIISYVTSVTEQNKRLFDYSTRWGQGRFRMYFPEFKDHIHLLRHWRTTHLLSGQATGKPVPMPVVAKMGGWKGTNVLSSTYDGTIIEDYWGF